jgi:tetrahedral aminopeptidase
LKDTIKKLVEAWGPSGYEYRVREIIREEVVDLADEITVDPLGNLICRVGSGGTKILVDAHMDEIGLIATFIEPKTGYLRFSPVGGLLHNTLTGSRVQFENGTTGVIGVHDTWGESRRNLPELDYFYIDVSDGSGNALVEPGSPAVFWRDMEARGSRLISKAMDDRIGCVVAIETMRRLNKQTPNEVYFVFAVQEEVGLRGAGTAAYTVDPDIAIALDVTGTGDEVKGRKMAVKLGGGAAIKIHDPGLVVPPAIRDWMVNRAEADGIPYQLELLAGGSTDAARIQISRSGVPSGVISIPCRFVHTTSETVDLNDVNACIDLLTGLVSNHVNL